MKASLMSSTRALFSDKARCFSPSERALYGNFIINCHNDYLKVYMTDFFLFARLNLPNVLISVAKKISIAIFLPRVLMCQKR